MQLDYDRNMCKNQYMNETPLHDLGKKSEEIRRCEAMNDRTAPFEGE